MTPGAGPKSAGEMMSDIMGNVGNLVRNEVDLARAETAASLKQAIAALGFVTLAIILAITGLNLLATALVAAVIQAGLTPAIAPLAVGGGLLLVAVVVYFSTKSTLTNIGLMPDRAARNVRRDAAAVKDAYNDK